MDRGFGRNVDDLIAAQYGVISRRQLMDAGISQGVIGHRLRTGALVPVDRGVYRARVAPPSAEQSLMAAVLGIGGAAVVSHQSAAHLWGLLGRRPEQPHVTTSTGRWRPKPFHVHRSMDLAVEHITSVRGIPTTTPVRTVVDLGASAPGMAVSAFNQVLRDRLVTLSEFESLIGDIGRQGRAGVGVIRRLVEERAKWVGTNESALEDEFRRIIDQAMLPIPVAQYEIRDDWGMFLARVDFAYPDRHLVIELDGYRFHSDPEAFARDRNRQNRLLLAGYRILRYTAKDLRQNSDRVVADLVRSLARAFSAIPLVSTYRNIAEKVRPAFSAILLLSTRNSIAENPHLGVPRFAYCGRPRHNASFPFFPRSHLMELTLRAETGRPMGSRPARRLRREGLVPATVYGREAEPVSVAVNARELFSVLHTEAGLNALITLDIEGSGSLLTMAKEVQRHPFRPEYYHVDFLAISLTEKVTTDVTVHLEGEPVGVRLSGGIIETLRSSVSIEALPRGIPSAIVVDISDLDIGDIVKISDLPVLEGVDYLDDPDAPVVTVAIPAAIIAEEEEAEEGLEEGEEGEEAAESAAAEESSDE